MIFSNYKQILFCGKNDVINHPCGNGNHTTFKNGDDWGMVYDIACFQAIKHEARLQLDCWSPEMAIDVMVETMWHAVLFCGRMPQTFHLSGIMISPLSTSAKNEKTAAKTGAAQNLSTAIFTWNHIECVEGLMIPQTSAFYKWMFIAIFPCAVPAPALEEPLWHRQDLHLHGADSDCPELRWTNCTSPIHSVLWPSLWVTVLFKNIALVCVILFFPW